MPLVVSEESAEALQNVDPSTLESTNDALGEASEFAVRYCGYRNVKKVHVELGSNGENLKAINRVLPQGRGTCEPTD